MKSLFLALFLITRMVFAPSEGFTNRLEKPWRDEVCLNGYWDLQPGEAFNGAWDSVKIKIPSPWNVNSFSNEGLEGPDHRDFPSYPERWDTLSAAWLHKTVTIPAEWSVDDHVFLHFEAVAGKAEVFVGQTLLAENFDLFLPFEADITGMVTPGERAEIFVRVRSQRLFGQAGGTSRRIVPAGSMWGTHIAGIWQDVYLVRRPAVRVEDVYVRPKVGEGILSAEVTLKNDTDRPVRLHLDAVVNEWLNLAGNTVEQAPVPAWELGREAFRMKSEEISLPARTTRVVTLESSAPLEKWTPEHPRLYALQVGLYQGKKQADNKYERFGYREWTLEGTELCLNGEPYPLRGDSWHFMGIPQMTRRYAWAWYTAIKAMNGNAVRLHAQVYPRFYMDMADEMGVCVLAETANWASDGGPALDNPAFWEHSKDHLRRMVLRDRNHPSVFGWSVSNENKPVILYVHRRPDLMPLQEQAWRDWVEIVREADPSRPWISSDGEEDGEGILPVTMGHYGDAGSMASWKAIGKPWGVGEHGMAYYGTPEEVSRYNAGRAYESAVGRMEGLAYESYGLIRAMREAGACYSTVFNMVWYALKPLPLGKRDLTSAPTMEDGIFFDAFREGLPGVQPERIGPYSTTLNPGYDPSLPLYDPWPMFEALRAANAPDAPAWSPWAEIPAEAACHEAACHSERSEESYQSVIYIGRPDGRLRRILDAQGVVLSGKPRGRTLYIVDALSLQNFAPKAGSDVWYWGITPESTEYYGLALEFSPLRRSSFIPSGRSWTAGMTNADFYFCEVQSSDACRYTLGGPFVDGGEVLLEACRTDWRRWNKRAEALKTAAVLRSENECTVPLPTMVKNGGILVSTMDNFLSSEKGYNALRTLLKHAGVPCREVEPASFADFDDGIYQPGILTRPVK